MSSTDDGGGGDGNSNNNNSNSNSKAHAKQSRSSRTARLAPARKALTTTTNPTWRNPTEASASSDSDSDACYSVDDSPLPPRLPRKTMALRTAVLYCIRDSIRVLASDGAEGWLGLAATWEALDVSSWRTVDGGFATGVSPAGFVALYTFIDLVDRLYRKDKELRAELSTADAKAQVQLFTRYDRSRNANKETWEALKTLATQHPVPHATPEFAELQSRLFDFAVESELTKLDLSKICQRLEGRSEPDLMAFDWKAWSDWWGAVDHAGIVMKGDEATSGVFDRVRHLDLSKNALSDLPDNLLQLTPHVEVLNIRSNHKKLVSVPASLLVMPLRNIHIRKTGLNVSQTTLTERGLSHYPNRPLPPARPTAYDDHDSVGPHSLVHLATKYAQSLIELAPGCHIDQVDLSAYHLSPLIERYLRESFKCSLCNRFILAPRAVVPFKTGDHIGEMVEFKAWFGGPIETLKRSKKASRRGYAGTKYWEGPLMLPVKARVCRPCLKAIRKLENPPKPNFGRLYTRYLYQFPPYNGGLIPGYSGTTSTTADLVVSDDDVVMDDA